MTDISTFETHQIIEAITIKELQLLSDNLDRPKIIRIFAN